MKVDTVLRWAGSKRFLITKLIEKIPNFNGKYCEPFCGSAIMFFYLKPSDGLLCDINSELINFFKCVAVCPEFIYDKLVLMSADKEFYDEVRGLNLEGLSEVERAIRFIYLNRYCFNGVYRTNKKGEFNVPMGINTGGIPNKNSFIKVGEALRKAVICCGDYYEMLNKYESGDFVYMDPPYVAKGMRMRGEYGVGSFLYKDLDVLIRYMEEIDKVGAFFLLSYMYDKDFYDLIKSNWRVELVESCRSIGREKKRINEIVVMNY